MRSRPQGYASFRTVGDIAVRRRRLIFQVGQRSSVLPGGRKDDAGAGRCQRPSISRMTRPLTGSAPGARLCGLPIIKGVLALVRNCSKMPDRIKLTDTRPATFLAGETLSWSLNEAVLERNKKCKPGL
jgi:hypothetical protein